ncbi:MAG: BNR-4 repeat-containing protein [Acetobacteraceae bacterium]
MSDRAITSPQTACLGAAWAGSSVNCVPFRYRAVLPVADGWLVSYYDAAGAVTLCHVYESFRVGPRWCTPSPVKPHDAHACISLGRGPEGDVHAVFGAHASTAWHVRVTSDLSACLQPPRPLTYDKASRLTYPQLLSGNDAPGLAMLYREGGAWRGEIRVARWRDDRDAFVPDDAPLLSGMAGRLGAGPYVNRPVRLPDGRVALFVVWRLPPDLTSAGDVANVGIDLVLADADLASLTTADGVALRRPVTPFHGARAWAVPPGMNLINQGSAACAPDGAPMALTYWDDARGIPQYQLLWRAGGLWHATPISDFRTHFALAGRGTLPLPHSRPEMLVRKDGAILCIFRSAEYGNRLMLSVHAPPYRAPCGAPRVLVDEDLGQYEPVVDPDTFHRDGSVVLFVQACHQEQGDGAATARSAPARLLRWPAADVSTW